MAFISMFPDLARAEASKDALLQIAASGDLHQAIAKAEAWLDRWVPPTTPVKRLLSGSSIARMRRQMEVALSLWRERAQHREILRTSGILALEQNEGNPLDAAAALRACILFQRATVLRAHGEDNRALLVQGETAIARSRRFRDLARLLPALKRERDGDLEAALAQYEALRTVNPTAELRRAIVLFKLRRPEEALTALQPLHSEEATYWRGLIHAAAGKCDAARKSWRGLTGMEIEGQREQLEREERRKRLIDLAVVQKACLGDDLESALAKVSRFRERYGNDPMLDANLERHLLPKLDRRDWESLAGHERAARLTASFFAQPDTRRLHTCFAALLEVARQYASAIPELACVGSAVLANLDRDFMAKPGEPDPAILRTALRDLLETLARTNEACRSNWRLDQAAASLATSGTRMGMTLAGLAVPPSFHLRYATRTNEWKIPKDAYHPLLESLYTPWGWALAAALDDDHLGAKALRPTESPSNKAEQHAQRVIRYRRGLSLLRDGNVAAAEKDLKPLQKQIAEDPIWRTEVDKGFEERMRRVSNAQEALALATRWREITDSPAARAQWVNEKVYQIATQLDDKRLSHEKALSELQDLLRVDSRNAKAQDLQRRIEEVRDIQAVFQQLGQGNVERAVAIARNSRHDGVAQLVAERLIESALEAIDRGRDAMGARELVVVAYRLKPRAPEFQEIYSLFRVR